MGVASYIRQYKNNNSYSLSGANCIHFVFNFVDKKYKTNFLDFLEPVKKHTDIKKVCRKKGYRSIVDFMNRNFKKIDKNSAKKGDIGYFCGYLAINDGLYFFMYTVDGLKSIPRSYIKRAWTWEK